MAVAQLIPFLIAKVSASAAATLMVACSEMKTSAWLCNRDGLVFFLYACTSDNNNGMRLSSLRIWFLLAASSQHLTG